MICGAPLNDVELYQSTPLNWSSYVNVCGSPTLRSHNSGQGHENPATLLLTIVQLQYPVLAKPSSLMRIVISPQFDGCETTLGEEKVKLLNAKMEQPVTGVALSIPSLGVLYVIVLVAGKSNR